MIDRSKSPDYGQLESIPDINAEKILLKNGIELHYINDDKQEVCQTDIVFPAGKIYNNKNLISESTIRMLEEGTKGKTGTELIDAFDYYGAYIENKPGMDRSEVSMYGLHKHADKTLALLREMIAEPAFRDEDLTRYKQRRMQMLQIQLNKADVVASRKFLSNLFGANHPYAIEVEPEDYLGVSSDDLNNFHKSYFLGCKPKIFAAGKIDDRFIKRLDEEFGNLECGDNDHWSQLPEIMPGTTKSGLEEIKMPGHIQCGLKVGKIFPGIKHEDSQMLSVLCTILGGYFGSRLMMNIREDKGYTYGIGAFISHMRNGSYFAISTQVANEVYINTLKEIRFELSKLCSELIGQKELDLVKNYLLGSLLRNFDGSFEKIERHKILIYNDLQESYYESLLHTIQGADSVQLLRLAEKYFKHDDFTEIVAGLD